MAIVAGLLAGSIALIGFGLDSYIETAAASVLIWRFRKHGVTSEEEEDRAEKRAILVVGITFLLLAAYVTYESARNLFLKEAAEESLLGIALAAVSLAVMPILAWGKHKVASRLGSRALRADALETLACSYLSLILLVGLSANALLGWWWADPLAGLAMVFFLVREGIEAVREGLDREAGRV